jgi:hypothetical protein
MALEQPEAGYVWLHVPRREAVDVVMCGEIHSWWSHWTGTPGGRQSQAVRCVRREVGECAWCAVGHEHRVRYVFPALLGADLRLVELGRVQYATLSLLVQEGSVIGRKLKLVREWDAKNAPIQVVPLGRAHVSREQIVCIEDHVAQLGRGQLALMRVPQSNPPSKPPKAGGEAATVSPQGVGGEAAPSEMRRAYDATRKRT